LSPLSYSVKSISPLDVCGNLLIRIGTDARDLEHFIRWR